ncbi:MAG: PPOX class F420-dependent oxidoreductase [Ilumatobacteraceae bacterium]
MSGTDDLERRTTDVIPDTHRDLLELTTVGQLATTGPSGEPQVTPVWFIWDGSSVLMSVTTARQKYRNMARDGRAALCISDPADAFRYLELRGPVELTADEQSEGLDVLARKYLRIEHYPWHMPGDRRVVVRLVPERCSVGFLPREYRVGIPAIE